jgi:hypothetical protein
MPDFASAVPIRSLEGVVSYLVGLFAIVAGIWELCSAYLGKTSRLHTVLEKFFKAVAKHWPSTALLCLAMAICTIAPIYEQWNLTESIRRRICAQLPQQSTIDLCTQSAASVRPLFSSFISDDSVHVFQFGVWLLVIFALGLIAQFIVAKSNEIDTRAQVGLISLVMGGLFAGAKYVQDWLQVIAG